MLIAGILLALGPIWGVLGTVLGMTLAFGQIAESEVQVDALASDISFALYTTVAGYIAFPIGIALIVTALIKLLKPKKQDTTACAAQQEH